MNHDVSHCSDYNRYICPETCFRAKVTQDLKDNMDKYEFIPMSFAHFEGTPYCEKTNKEVAK